MKALRILRGWSREALAAESSLAPDLIIAIEQAAPRVSFEDVACLARALGVSLGDLLDPAEWALVRIASIETDTANIEARTD